MKGKSVIVALCLLFQTIIYAQDSLLIKPVSLKFSNIPLKDAFREIERQLNCYFTFESSTINLNKNLNLTFKSVQLKICLNKILEDTTLVYKTIANHIIIKKKLTENQLKVKEDSIPPIITLRGQIVDYIDKEPLAFVTIGILDYSIGSVSNAQGEFILKIPQQLLNQKICISNLGYKNMILPVNQIIDTFKIFQLERSFITIQEVIIRKTDAKSLIKSALGKIEKNYSLKPVYLTGFYRESVRRRGSYMFFSEAIVQVYKTSYIRSNEIDLIKVLKSRKMQDVTQEDTVILKLKSGLQTCIDLDLVKNPINFLNEESYDLYDYNMTDIVTFNDRNAYLIEFEQKKSVDEALFQGKIYIDIEKMAIIGAEFSINPLKVIQAQANYVVRKKRGLKVRMTNIDYMVNYRLIGDKYYLNYVRGDLKMKVKKNGKIFPVDFETSLEMAINELDTINVERFKRAEAENPYTIFFDDVYEYDEEYWENYNFMKPDEPLQESIKKLSLKTSD